MTATLQELSTKVERIEKFLQALIDVNLDLIEEVEPEDWEIQTVKERKDNEFLDWKSVENEL
ncbi:hypothetical protein Asulf_02041 [Archaeoglobus sulfaticallidus PM70-1]|uniref:Uncharacterized protein n=1 Tax=Archaeoglobus sulfaticallidus PM70-1 TaxID=387631 RepID=N0BEH1_9EURY|nr:hypothetical protein [Archaeoglobus sulfaticallidus]AGK62004.1 hypothetical protein Asulf_02041 [Archaeoglobus sulfaticallidus PM70-1]